MTASCGHQRSFVCTLTSRILLWAPTTYTKQVLELSVCSLLHYATYSDLQVESVEQEISKNASSEYYIAPYHLRFLGHCSCELVP
jgi:hypothetical protein